VKSLWRNLAQKLAKVPALALLAAGAVGALVLILAYDVTMHATGTEEFCISCHSIRENTWPQFQESSHFANASGVNATCSDCHLPKEFVPKLVRKVQAAREVWGELRGVIDTPEKYAAHAPAMKAREIARLTANDSRECRNCHSAERMLLELQSVKAQEYHGAMERQGKTCIDCHQGIAHPKYSEQLAQQ
jgi:cytochrome c-type protein NapC